MFHFLIPTAIVFAIVVRVIYNAYRPGISDIPGPWICKYTDGYRMYRAWRGDNHLWLQELRAKYGELVRIGPNVILDSERGEFQKVFGFKEDYEKSDGIKIWQAVVNGKVIHGTASVQNKTIHAKLRRPVANLYSNTNVVSYEPRVHETIKFFLQRLDEEFMSGRMAGRRCDIDNWVQYLAFDIVGQLTLSRRLGFLKEGRDVGGVLNELHNEMEYRGTVQNMPWIDKLIRKNPIYLYFRQPTSFFAANSRKLVGERLADEKHTGIDMLDGFLEAQKKYPDLVDQPTLAMYISTNFLAGSDTTSVTMRTIIYHVLRTPSVLETLRKELDANITTYPPDYNTAMSLTYLDAIIREALRIHPIGSLVFERKVPASGHITEASGRQLPPGAVIAQTPWTLNFDEDLWGPEPYAFRPERWLKYEDESVEAAEKRIYHMKHHDFSFSYGPRGCLGKHIAWMEMVEVMPTLFGLLDMRPADLKKDWRVTGSFFTRQYDMDVVIKWRDGVDKSQVLC